MRTTRFQKIQMGIITVMIVLLLVLLFMLGIRKNAAVWNVRDDNSFITVQNMVYNQIEDTASPGGKVSEFTFTLDDNTLVHDTDLIFYASHQLIDVWIGDEYVYSLKPSGQLSFIIILTRIPPSL